MQPVRSDVKMDAVTWKEMFLTFIFADDLAKSSVAGQYGFMPHWLDNFYFPTYGNMIFWWIGNIRKLHMFRPKPEIYSPSLRNMGACELDGHCATNTERMHSSHRHRVHAEGLLYFSVKAEISHKA